MYRTKGTFLFDNLANIAKEIPNGMIILEQNLRINHD